MLINYLVKKVKSSLINELSLLAKLPDLEVELAKLESKIITTEKQLKVIEQSQQQFTGHYEIWREKRVTAIIEHYGPLWFKDKKILEVGCGYADIGIAFTTLGAVVTCSDARQEHLDVVNERYPFIKTVLADINIEWPFDDEYDLIIHMGVLYHLENIAFSLEKTLQAGTQVILETEVSDSSSGDFVLQVEENSNGYDQSITGLGSRPSIKHLENYFNKYSMQHERLETSSCNSTFHQYNWKQTGSDEWRHGLRAMWFISKKSQ